MRGVRHVINHRSSSNSLPNSPCFRGCCLYTSKIAIFLGKETSPDRDDLRLFFSALVAGNGAGVGGVVGGATPRRWWGAVRNLLCRAAFWRGLFEYCYVTVMHVCDCVSGCNVRTSMFVASVRAYTCVLPRVVRNGVRARARSNSITWTRPSS